MELWGRYKWPYKWATRVITLLIGVILPDFITGRGPPCTISSDNSPRIYEICISYDTPYVIPSSLDFFHGYH